MEIFDSARAVIAKQNGLEVEPTNLGQLNDEELRRSYRQTPDLAANFKMARQFSSKKSSEGLSHTQKAEIVTSELLTFKAESGLELPSISETHLIPDSMVKEGSQEVDEFIKQAPAGGVIDELSEIESSRTQSMSQVTVPEEGFGSAQRRGLDYKGVSILENEVLRESQRHGLGFNQGQEFIGRSSEVYGRHFSFKGDKNVILTSNLSQLKKSQSSKNPREEDIGENQNTEHKLIKTPRRPEREHLSTYRSNFETDPNIDFEIASEKLDTETFILKKYQESQFHFGLPRDSEGRIDPENLFNYQKVPKLRIDETNSSQKLTKGNNYLKAGVHTGLENSLISPKFNEVRNDGGMTQPLNIATSQVSFVQPNSGKSKKPSPLTTKIKEVFKKKMNKKRSKTDIVGILDKSAEQSLQEASDAFSSSKFKRGSKRESSLSPISRNWSRIFGDSKSNSPHSSKRQMEQDVVGAFIHAQKRAQFLNHEVKNKKANNRWKKLRQEYNQELAGMMYTHKRSKARKKGIIWLMKLMKRNNLPKAKDMDEFLHGREQVKADLEKFKKRKGGNIKKATINLQKFEKKFQRTKSLVQSTSNLHFEDPDYKLLQKYRKEAYITDQKGNLYSFCRGLREPRTIGWFSCFEVKETAFDKAGPGLALFFSFLKATMIFFLICIFLTIPVHITNIALYKKSRHPNLKPLGSGFASNFYGGLVSTTLGAISSFNQNMFDLDYKHLKQNKSLLLSCEFGMVSINPNQTKFGLVQKWKSLDQLQFSIKDKCTNYTDVMYSLQPCIGKKLCNVESRMSWFNMNDRECDELINGKEKKEWRPVLSIHCKHVLLSLYGEEPRSIIKIYMFCFGAFWSITIFFFYYLMGLYKNEREILKFYKVKHHFPNQYTLELKNVPQYMTEPSLIESVKKKVDDLYKKINKDIKKESFYEIDEVESPIQDIKVAQPYKIFLMSKKLDEYEERKQQLIVKLMAAWRTNKIISAQSVDLELLKDKIMNFVRSAARDQMDDVELKKDAKSSIKILDKLSKIHEKMETLETKIKEIKKTTNGFKSVFVTFETREQKEAFLTLLPRTRVQVQCWKFSKIFKCGKYFMHVNNSYIYADDPPEPVNINWKNFNMSLYEKNIRRLISFAIFIGTLLIPILANIIFSYFKSKYEKNLPSCSSFTTHLDEIQALAMANNWSPREDGFTCLCITRFVETTSKFLKKQGLNENHCTDMRNENQYLVYIKYAESIFLATISVVLDYFFEMVGNFEGYTNYNSRTSSVLFKLFIWKFYISSLLPLLTLSRMLDLGRRISTYDDFTPSWYTEQGSAIIMGIYMRIPVMIIDLLCRYWLPLVLQAWDRGFKKQDPKGEAITSQTVHKRYVSVYKNMPFDIDRSYAEVLNIIFFTSIYWVMLPHIFVPNLFLLGVIYYKDKILNLTTYRLKYHFDEKSFEYVRFILSFVPLLIIISAVWSFGNTAYMSTNNIYQDVRIETQATPNPDTSSPIKILTALTIPQAPLKLDTAKINQKIPLDYSTNNAYDTQFLQRFFSTDYSLVMTYGGIIYIGFILVKLVYNISGLDLARLKLLKLSFLITKKEENEKNEKGNKKKRNRGGIDKEPDIKFSYLIPPKQVMDQKKLQNILNLWDGTCSTTMNLFEKRVVRTEHELRDMNKDIWKVYIKPYHFNTLASYDYRLNQKYKDFCLEKKDKMMLIEGQNSQSKISKSLKKDHKTGDPVILSNKHRQSIGHLSPPKSQSHSQKSVNVLNTVKKNGQGDIDQELSVRKKYQQNLKEKINIQNSHGVSINQHDESLKSYSS